MIWLLIAGAAAAWYFLHAFDTVNGLRHFNEHGRAEALTKLQGVSIVISSTVVSAGASFNTVQHNNLNAEIDGLTAVQTAEAEGGIVLLSESFLDQPVGALMVIVPPGNETIAIEGSGLAILSVTPA